MSNQGGQIVQRSWTEAEQPTSKWYAVTLLATALVVALILYFYLKRPQVTHTTFFASIHCDEYGDYFPSRPRWGFWQSVDKEAIDNRCREQGLLPWVTLNIDATAINNSASVAVQSKQQFVSALSNIRSLNQARIAPQHSVVIQIRCHGLIGQKDGNWSCGLHLGESGDSKQDILWVDELLQLVSDIGADNVILLADICDLRQLPEKSLIANPIASHLKQACASYSSGQRNIWIVCAADDCQPAHYSDVVRKTLFQEACEAALHRPSDVNSKVLSLADYFAALRDYSARESAGAQTPVLLRAGANDFVSLTDTTARQVVVNRFVRKGTAKSATQPATDTNASQKETAQAKSAPTSEDAKQVKNFWQFKDRIAWDDPPRCEPTVSALADQSKAAAISQTFHWHPAAFAPAQWRTLQMRLARAETGTDGINPAHLGEFMKCLSTQQKCEEFPGELQTLVRSWNDFLAANLNRGRWINQDEFVGTDFDRWTALRREYVEYIASVAEVLGWRDLAFELPREFGESFEELVSVIRAEKSKLPTSANGYALSGTNMMRVGKPRARLIDRLNDLVDQLHEETRWRRNLWDSERICQVLLRCPLLCATQREDLEKLKQKYVSRASRDADFFERVSQQKESSAKNDANTVEPVANLTKLASLLESLWSPGITNESAGSKQDWRMAENPQFATELDRWHGAMLLDNFVYNGSSKSTSGIVVLPCDPQAIQFVTSPTARVNFLSSVNTRDFAIDIKRVLNHDFDLTWRGDNLPDDFSVKVEGRAVKLGQRMRISGNAKRIGFQFSRNSVNPLASNAIIQFNTFDNEKPTGSIGIPVVVDEEHIELIARTDGPGGPVDVQNNLNAATRAQGEFNLMSPAIEESSTRYPFALRNKLPRPRRAIVRLYVVNATNVAGYVTGLRGPGSPAAGELAKFLIAESAIVDLPAFTGALPTVDLKFTTKAPAPDTTSPQSASSGTSANDARLVFWIEEQPIQADPSATRTPSTSVPAALTSSVYVSQVVPQKPSELRFDRGNSIICFPAVATVGQRVQVEAKVQHDQLWEQRELTKLNIEARFLTAAGVELDKQQVELNAKQVSTSMLGPILELDAGMRIELDVGAFPRAFVYQFNRSSNRFERTFSPLVRFESSVTPIINGSDVLRQSAEKVIRESQAEQNSVIVFPALLDGQAVKYTGIALTTSLDVGERNQAQLIIRKDAQISRRAERPWRTDTIATDRTYLTTFNIANGDLKVSTATTEWQTKLILPGIREGIFEFELSSSNQRQSTTVILDTTPPTKCSFVMPRTTLRGGDKLATILVDVLDGGDFGSGVEQVEIALANGRLQNRFPKNPSGAILKAEPESQGAKRWFVSLTPEYFKDLPSGNYYAYARATDRAGNREELHDINKPHLVVWENLDAKSKKK